MQLTRLNLQTIREVEPTISFTLTHLDGITRDEVFIKLKHIKCFEIQYKATGNTALQLLAGVIEMSKKLEVTDMHVSYKRGNIIFQVLTIQDPDLLEQYVQQKGRAFYIYYSINRKRKNLSLWMNNKEQINEGFKASAKLQRFVSNLAKNLYAAKHLVLN